MSLLSKLKNRRQPGKLKTGLQYTRRSFEFQLDHPIIAVLGLVQLVVAWVALFGVIGLLFTVDLGEATLPVALGVFIGYVVVSIATTLTNAVITGYVFAAEMGVITPLSHAFSHVRRRLPALLGYALLSATVLTVLRFGMTLLRGRAIIGEAVAWIIEATALAAWYAGTVYAVPVLLFEEGTSFRRLMPRSASLLRESKWTYTTIVTAWPVVLAFIVLAFGSLFVIGGTAGLVGFVGALVTGLVVYRLFNSIFKAYLYGEVAGPFSLSNT